jgi:glycylpeptide N-tetradecanoyltransferase
LVFISVIVNVYITYLHRALMSPGWLKEWHVGVRATRSKKLVAFISGVPIALRVRAVVIEKSTEINFLCIHKKLRSKRLAPVLIEEVTRRCNLLGVYQAIYTGGIVLPKPVSSCRYFHRPLDWMKLYEAGFSGLPHKSTPARQVAKHNLPNATSLPGLRPMQKQDAAAVQDLLSRYLKLFDMAPEYSVEEIEHWLVHDEEKYAEQVVWAYVVEDPTTQKITDFFSYYCLESVVIGSSKHKRVRAAYCFYYGTETAFEKNEKGLKERLNALMADCLITAKKVRISFLALHLRWLIKYSTSLMSSMP